MRFSLPLGLVIWLLVLFALFFGGMVSTRGELPWSYLS